MEQPHSLPTLCFSFAPACRGLKGHNKKPFDRNKRDEILIQSSCNFTRLDWIEVSSLQCDTGLFCPQADVELPIPRYFLSENAKVLKEREKLLGSILAQMEAQNDTKVSVCV